MPTRAPGAETAPSQAGPLSPGQAFGPRYQIIRLLGIGGMGAVYQAWDAELGVAVALKVIRPEATAEPAQARALERRFKQELLLARQVTHKNVVRIHDLGEIDGIKYITMPYIEGSDLATVLKQAGKLPVPAVLKIARQLASGLSAAHEAGVVHRDLKPANIMIEADRALIMDFGIARSASRGGVPAPAVLASAGHERLNVTPGAAATVAGAVIGTVEYMAPEQAKAQPVDHRADIYAFGLILYDMLLGGRHAKGAKTAVEELKSRMQHAPPNPRSVDPTISEPLDRLISRCFEPDPAARYQTTAALVADLERLDDEGSLIPEPRRLGWKSFAAAALVVISLLIGTWWAARTPAPAKQPPPVSVLIADFDNQTRDAAFEGSLEQALRIGIEGASFINTYPRKDARDLAGQLKPGSRIDEPVARLIAIREGIAVILTGSVAPADGAYSITIRVVDPSGQKPPTTFTGSATSREKALETVGSLAGRIRTTLGDVTPERELARAETFTTSSLEAVRSYTLAQDLAYAERDEDAIAHFKRAIELDANFGRAYAGWALSATHLGRRDEAATLWKRTLSLLDRVSEREKYRTLGTYYSLVARDYDKAIDNYTTLLKLYPGDATGHGNLGVVHFRSLNFAKAMESGRRAIELMPRSLRYRVNYALYAMYAGDFASASAEAARIIKDDASDPYAYLPLAIGALAGSNPSGARDVYAAMAKTGALGASLAHMGLADVAMYEGRYSDAEALLRAGMAEDTRQRNSDLLAAKLNALGEIRLAQGRTRLAVDAAHQALALGRDPTIVVPVARVLLRASQPAEAKTIAAELGNSLQPQTRAYGHLILGELALQDRRYFEALEALRNAQKLADLWLTRFLMGVTYVEAGGYAEALSELERCEKRRGEATALYLNDIPSFRYLAPLPYWLARAQEGVGLIPRATETYKKYLTAAGQAAKDPLAADARKRLAALGQ